MRLSGGRGDLRQIGFLQKVMTYNFGLYLLGHFLAETGVLGESPELAHHPLDALLRLEDGHVDGLNPLDQVGVRALI